MSSRYSEYEDQVLRQNSAEIASSIHAEAMTPRSRKLAREDDDLMRTALLSGQVRFPPNGWWTDCWFYVKNDHVFISVFLAHPSHPYTRERRFLVLLNSLSFAFFVTALFQVIIPVKTLRVVAVLVCGTLLQIMWDVPAAMLGTCPCAHLACLPAPLRRLCSCASFACLCCRTLLGLALGAFGLAVLIFLAADQREEFFHRFVMSKLMAFATGVPIAMLIYSLLQCCEAWQVRRATATGKLDTRFGAELL